MMSILLVNALDDVLIHEFILQDISYSQYMKATKDANKSIYSALQVSLDNRT